MLFIWNSVKKRPSVKNHIHLKLLFKFRTVNHKICNHTIFIFSESPLPDNRQPNYDVSIHVTFQKCVYDPNNKNVEYHSWCTHTAVHDLRTVPFLPPCPAKFEIFRRDALCKYKLWWPCPQLSFSRGRYAQCCVCLRFRCTRMFYVKRDVNIRIISPMRGQKNVLNEINKNKKKRSDARRWHERICTVKNTS